MRKLTFLALTGLAVAGLTLATPAESRADHRHGRGRGLHLDLGGFHLDIGRPHGHYHGGHYGRGSYYSPGYGGYYGRGYGGYYGGGYGGYYGRPSIVHPTELHWTPYRGWHEHGHIHVPHRGHYHTYHY